MDHLKEFLEQEFHVSTSSSKQLYPGLPLLMSLIDSALDRRQEFGKNWNFELMLKLREQVEFGIFDLLEERLELSPTNNHWILLDRLFPASGEEPCVISTNYDLIVDTTLMYLSKSRWKTVEDQEGRLPDYCCHIRTEYYNRQRFGTLLKLHGSLNWLCCKTCGRLELGASSSNLYGKVLARMTGQALKDVFSADGADCPTCKTKLRPLLIAPTHRKDYRNPHLAQVWYEAERVLREATRVFFIGYSLPDDDVEVVYLLKRCLSRSPLPQITVIEFDKDNPNCPAIEHSAGRRYRTLFGDGINWNACGLDGWLDKPQVSVAGYLP